MNIWLTSDTHFGHKKILEYERPGFASIEEHDEAIIATWNQTVDPKDTVYHLGDFALAPRSRTLEIARRLNGQKFLIRGNHDSGITGEVAKCFGWIKDIYRLRHGEHRIVLCHYPLEIWEGRHRGHPHAHGHCHGNLKRIGMQRRKDVGIDANAFSLVHIDQFIAFTSSMMIDERDHHTPRGER